MIKSFKHKKLEKLHTTGNQRGLNPEHIRRIQYILTRLDSAQTIEEMILPSYRLHRLSGSMRTYWAITVRANWRIVFEFEDGHVFHVDMMDYH
ncbi:MAG: hypothetical protein GY948_24760 [Alphaproteobacteria bacterium]|nr:hypothetical protein [Alphaproteobacteria bacterium]